MAYDIELAQRVRDYLQLVPKIWITEKRMFGGLAFIVNGKMCVNISGEGLMCRFNEDDYELVSKRKGYRPMIMRGKHLRGYCYVSPDGFNDPDDFSYWLELCLIYNDQARSSSKG